MSDQSLTKRLSKYNKRIHKAPIQFVSEGVVTRIVGLSVEVIGCKVPIGAGCHIITPEGDKVLSEVVGFEEDKTYLMPVDSIDGIIPGSVVVPTGHMIEVPVGNGLLGRVINGKGQPLDGKGPIEHDKLTPLNRQTINPLERARITEPLDVGVRAINALLTVGNGQRIGLFAGSGVGKSILLGMMTRNTTADVVVVGLVGERGREVKEFIEENLREDGLARSVVVAAPADEAPLLRLHAAMLATSIAEYFRDQGKRVLLLMDSLTRYAQAQREISLAIGEPPATKGYTPSVFSKLPKLVERAGTAGSANGSITAFYTVLTEGDDQQDPIADSARAILDGHIVLSRDIADRGLFPAIDIERSVSRVMPNIVPREALEAALGLKKLYSTYQQNRDLVSVGAYTRGADPMLDNAIRMMPAIEAFLAQSMFESISFQTATEQLQFLLEHARQAQNQPPRT